MLRKRVSSETNRASPRSRSIINLTKINKKNQQGFRIPRQLLQATGSCWNGVVSFNGVYIAAMGTTIFAASTFDVGQAFHDNRTPVLYSISSYDAITIRKRFSILRAKIHDQISMPNLKPTIIRHNASWNFSYQARYYQAQARARILIFFLF